MDLNQLAALRAAGFSLDHDLKTAMEADAKAKGLHETGPYVVDSAMRKGLVTLRFEQNTATDHDVSGQQVTVKYAPVCVVEGPSGKCSCAASDTDLILTLAGDLA